MVLCEDVLLTVGLLMMTLGLDCDGGLLLDDVVGNSPLTVSCSSEDS